MTRPRFTDRDAVRSTLVGVKMSAQELETLDAARLPGEGRSTALRRLAMEAIEAEGTLRAFARMRQQRGLPPFSVPD